MAPTKSLSAIEAAVERNRHRRKWALAAIVVFFLSILVFRLATTDFGDPEATAGFTVLLIMVLFVLLMFGLALTRVPLPEEVTKAEVVKYRLSRLVHFLSEYNKNYDDDLSRGVNKKGALRQATYLLRSFAPFIPEDGRPHIPLSYTRQTRFDLFTEQLGEFGKKVQSLVYLLAGILKAEKPVPPDVVGALELLRDHLDHESRHVENVHLVDLNDAISGAETVGIGPDTSLGKSPMARFSTWVRARISAVPRLLLHAAVLVVVTAVYWLLVLLVPATAVIIPPEQRFTAWLALLLLTVAALRAFRS